MAASEEEFIERVLELARDTSLRLRMGRAARERVAGISWDAAFDLTYEAYRHCKELARVRATANKTSKAALRA